MKKELTIGNIKIYPPVALAPMAGYTDTVYRKICKNMGVGLVFTELVSADGILYNPSASIKYAEFSDEERPIAIQIFGHSPHIMADAANYLYETLKPDIIDINIGCPVKKVVKKGAGAALLKNLDTALKIAEAIVKNVPVPVTVKMRKGWDKENIVPEDFFSTLENLGIKAITIHGRTAKDSFSSPAEWDIIKKIKQILKIPVIGNGDIKTPVDALRMFETTGCDGIMVGRAAIGNPWIFKQILELFHLGEIHTRITLRERIKVCMEHIKAYSRLHGPELANRIIKKHIVYYVKSIPEASRYRHALVNAKTLEDTLKLLTEITKKL